MMRNTTFHNIMSRAHLCSVAQAMKREHPGEGEKEAGFDVRETLIVAPWRSTEGDKYGYPSNNSGSLTPITSIASAYLLRTNTETLLRIVKMEILTDAFNFTFFSVQG